MDYMDLNNGRYDILFRELGREVIVFGYVDKRGDFFSVPKKDERSVRAFLRGYGIKKDLGKGKEGKKVNRFSPNVRIRFEKKSLDSSI